MPFADKSSSKIKMVMLTGPRERNITWYSPIDQNKKPSDEIIAGMLRRFSDNYEKGKIPVKVQVVQFYENGNLIDEYKF